MHSSMMEILHFAYGLEIQNLAHTRIMAWLDSNLKFFKF